MYIKKSTLSRIVMLAGAFILAVLAILYCFTEINIPGIVYIFAWIGSIIVVMDVVSWIEQ